MALVKCPDCAKDVSSAAAACIHCGRPMRGAAPALAHGTPVVPMPPQVQTVEQTGKSWKAIQLVGGVLAVIGGLGACTHPVDTIQWAVPTAALGAFLFLVGRLGAWWNHG